MAINDDAPTASQLRFAIGAWSLGRAAIAVSSAGVAAILLDDSEALLARDLKRLFPQSAFDDTDRCSAQMLTRVINFIEDPAQDFDLPIDPHGTAFQRAVWQALREIPAGTTTTYSEIADRIGSPKATRAVAAACAANKIAVAVPCHRVLRRDGSLSGYRWGVDRKRLLLERERLAVACMTRTPAYFVSAT